MRPAHVYAIKMYVRRIALLSRSISFCIRPDEAEALAPKCQGFNDRFIREANLVLGVPYDPTLRTRQVRDFYGGDTRSERLEGRLSSVSVMMRHANSTRYPRRTVRR